MKINDNQLLMICSGEPIFSIFLYDVGEQTFTQLQVSIDNMLLTEFENIQIIDLSNLTYLIVVSEQKYLLDLSEEYSLC